MPNALILFIRDWVCGRPEIPIPARRKRKLRERDPAASDGRVVRALNNAHFSYPTTQSLKQDDFTIMNNVAIDGRSQIKVLVR